MQLLVRLYTPTGGTVSIDGHDLTGMSSASVRSQVLLVTQEAQLFDGTVTENILFGRPGATEEQVIDAAKTLGAHEAVTGLRNGYETRVGERGSRLSVGERQLIALARAMLADPRVIVLDEAVSSVDPARQRLVLSAIRRLLEGRTAVVVAHWLPLVEDLDQVFVIEDGRIVESGLPVELFTAGGRLTELCDAQEGRTPRNTPERTTPMSDTNLGNMFWNATQQTPTATAEEPKKASSCCGPKPAAEAAPAEPKKTSSCCGPKPAADSAAAPKKTSSCCGPKPAATTETEGAAAPKKSSCCG